MEMKSLSSHPLAGDKSILVTKNELNLEAVIQKIKTKKQGAIVIFLGTVRESENDVPIQSITYQAYEEMAVKEIEKIGFQTQERWPVKVAVEHRIGKVPVGEVSVIVACAGSHRGEAFEACRHVVGEIKTRVPVWKVKF